MKIPFYPNTEDGIHCWQAALKMALATFEPEREYSFTELDRITDQKQGKWTWPTAGLLWLLQQKYEIRLIGKFDYHAFADEGEKYLLRRLGEEVGRAQIEKSDVQAELKYARAIADIAPLEVRAPSLRDIETLIKEGFVVICHINPSSLYGYQGYTGHYVIVCEVTEDDVVLHDPGLPPKPSYKATKRDFNRAWSYPEKNDRVLLAIRR